MTGIDPGRPEGGRRAWILAIDTATTRAIVAAGLPDGTPIGLTTWVAGYRHGQTLLPAIGRLAGEANLRRSRLVGIVVGTGPGAFTGLRVGIATAKALAHALGQPIVGISTAEALLAAVDETGSGPPASDTDDPDAAAAEPGAAGGFALLLPAGPSDRTFVDRPGASPTSLPAGSDPDVEPGRRLVAVDLPDRAPADALARGDRALERLGPVLLRLGAARLTAGDADDLAELVPEYVSLPRGVRAAGGSIEWSHGPR